MNSEVDVELDQILCQTAASNSRLLSALRRWRAEMPDALLETALSPEPTDDMLLALKVETGRVSHRQMLAHLHFTASEKLRNHSLEPVLRAARLRNGLRNKKILLERNEIMARLQTRGMEALIFKGADLAYSVYPDACCRVVGDIDLLVEEEKYDRAEKALQAENFVPENPACLEMRKGLSRMTSWTHPEFTISLDVQVHANHLARWPGADRVLFDHATTRDDVLSGEIRGLCAEHALVQVCGHGLAQNYHPPVRWAADAVWIIRTAGDTFDWDLVLEATNRNHSTQILLVALSYLRLAFGADISQEVMDQLRSRPSRGVFQTAWSYRLDMPCGPRERVLEFSTRFRLARPDEHIWRAPIRLPKYLRETQNTSSAITAVGKLARKAILNRYS